MLALPRVSSHNFWTALWSTDALKMSVWCCWGAWCGRADGRRAGGCNERRLPHSRGANRSPCSPFFPLSLTHLTALTTSSSPVSLPARETGPIKAGWKLIADSIAKARVCLHPRPNSEPTGAAHLARTWRLTLQLAGKVSHSISTSAKPTYDSNYMMRKKLFIALACVRFRCVDLSRSRSSPSMRPRPLTEKSEKSAKVQPRRRGAGCGAIN